MLNLSWKQANAGINETLESLTKSHSKPSIYSLGLYHNVHWRVVLSQTSDTRWPVPYLTERRIISYNYKCPLQLQRLAELQISKSLRSFQLARNLSLYVLGIYAGIAGGRIALAGSHIQQTRLTLISTMVFFKKRKLRTPEDLRQNNKTWELLDPRKALQILETYMITVRNASSELVCPAFQKLNLSLSR